MKINGISQFSILTVIGVLLLLAGVGLSIKGGGIQLPTFLFLGATLLFLVALPLFHLTMTKPLSHLRKEVDAFSRAWISSVACGLFIQGLRRDWPLRGGGAIRAASAAG